jgi:hypothetical protein
MTKKLMIIVLIVYFVFVADFNVSATHTTALETDDLGSKRPNSFIAAVKKTGRYLLLYIPNRIVDATDIITFNMNVGDGFWAEMQMTRFAQMGGSYSEGYFMTKAYSRQFGFGHKDTKRFGLVYLENDVTLVNETSGSVNEYMIFFPHFAVADHNLAPFQDEDVDFWKAGGNIGWFIGVGFGIHPIEIADFITGIIGLDISEDDF